LARLAEDVAAGEAAEVAGGAAAAAGIVPLQNVMPAAMERIIAFDSVLANALDGAANAGANAGSVTWHSVDEMCTLHTCIGAATFSPLSTPDLLDVINAANFLEHFEVLDVALVEMATRFVGMKLVDVNAVLAAADLEPLSRSGNSEHKLGSYAYDCASGPAATRGGGGGGGGGAAAAAAAAAASSGAGAVVGGVSNARVEQDHVQGQLCVAADGTPFVLEHHVIEKCKALNPASPFVQSTTKGVISTMLATLERQQAATAGAATGVVAEQHTTTSTGTTAERTIEKSVSAASATVDSTVATPTVTPNSSLETKAVLIAAVRQLCEYEPALAAMLRDILLTMNPSCTLSGINSATLAKVIEYCTYHMDDLPQDDDSQKSEPITGWDAEFVQMDQASLFELILAANTLDCKPLLDLACKAVAEMIKGKTPEEIRNHFNIENDFTAEEEEQVRRENEWCEEHHA
jgi:S-phase kinase-associated protein 1